MTKFDRTTRRARQAERAARRALAGELACHTSTADLAELDAMLRRHHDAAEAENVRSLIDWSRAA